MSTANAPSIFDQIVADFDNKVPCVWITQSDRQCQRGANWNLDVHGCFGGTLCGHHYWEWHRMNIGRRYCGICVTDFPSFTSAFTARKL